MVKRYWAAAVNDIETNPCLVEGWVPVHLSSDYDALVRLLKSVQSDAGNWLHGDLQKAIEEAVGPEEPYRPLDDSGVDGGASP